MEFAIVARAKQAINQVRGGGSLYGAGMVTLVFSQKMSQLIGKYVYSFLNKYVPCGAGQVLFIFSKSCWVTSGVWLP